MITIRPFAPADAESVVRVHWEAVHETAGADYPPDILNEWSIPVTPERVQAFRATRATSKEITLVAEKNGHVVGFGAFLPATNELTAIYVLPEAGSQGVGKQLLQELERLARERGLTELHLDSSLTAEPFYRANGYVRESTEEHTRASGRKMPAVQMRRAL